MNVQFVLAVISLVVLVVVVALTAMGILPGPTKAIDTWSVARPTAQRRWLAAAFWTNMALSVAACGLIVGTTGQMLAGVWSDVGQCFIWLAMTIDAVIAQRRLWLAFSIIFLAFSMRAGWPATPSTMSPSTFNKGSRATISG